jgi:drug/metabolite transporter (DMT)-like permease
MPGIILLYGATVLIWGSTWIMIRFQLGVVAPQASIVYRFVIAALALALFAKLAGKSLAIRRADYGWVALQGLFLFSANYYFVYHGTAFITSGLVAVVFTLIVQLNIVNERLFFGTRIDPLVVLAGFMGAGGVAMMFWPEISRLSVTDESVRGLLLVLTGAIMASFGNMAAIRNTRRRIGVIALNTHAMAIGSAISAAVAFATGEAFTIDWRPAYIGSLLYLAIPGTAIAFGFYLVLIDRLGATKAAYTAVMLPVVALLISTFAEGYQWSALSVGGMLVALTGNAIALSTKRPLAPGPVRPV